PLGRNPIRFYKPGRVSSGEHVNGNAQDNRHFPLGEGGAKSRAGCPKAPTGKHQQQTPESRTMENTATGTSRNFQRPSSEKHFSSDDFHVTSCWSARKQGSK
ncbi:hypothetical protein H1C71_011290, partial [Ictidomys tridecemlineatus]